MMLRAPVWMSAILLVFLAGACDEGPADGVGSGEREIIYGADNRFEPFETTNAALLMAVDATVVLMDETALTPVSGGYSLNYNGTFGQSQLLCSSERFRSQPDPGWCSGFKVGDDLLVTAGHCITNTSDCANTAFVFGFEMTNSTTAVRQFPTADVYGCSQIVGRVETSTNDWAVIRTDRPIVNRPSLPIRRTGAVESDPQVAALFDTGHMSGIPVKIFGGPQPVGTTGLSGATVRATQSLFFETNLDVYGGNSGSVVFSLRADGTFHAVEGILVRGNNDFVQNGSCYVSQVCPDTGCTGSAGSGWEEVTRIANLASLIPPPCGDGVCDAGQSCLTCAADCGACGPTARVFEDRFSSGLGQWTVGGSWTTNTVQDAENYPSAGSGSPAAYSISCGTCDLDMAGTVDLSGLQTATVQFAYFVDNSFDSGEELTFWAFDGTWVRLLQITPPNDTDRWEAASLVVPTRFMAPGVRFGFQARMSGSGEFVQIDDFVITGTLPAPSCSTAADCDDGVFCNGAETCSAGSCVAGTPVACGDGVACTADSCNEATDACDHVPNDAACSDGLYCNGAEACDVVLGCVADTPVNCADGVSCTNDGCNEATDSCFHTPVHSACNDGQFCNGSETCDGALGCLAGTAVDCSDGVGCTIDGCDETGDACVNVLDHGVCDNGEFCDGAEACTAAGCQPGGDPCTGQGCDEVADACVACTSDAQCSDGLFCNGAEVCNAGVCGPGTAPSCDDGVSCTADSCSNAAGACLNAPVHSACSDGLFCNGTETCDAGLGCVAGTAVDCGDAVSCTIDSCNEATDSCGHAPDHGACGDGLFCNGAEVCSATAGCQSGADPCAGQTCDETGDVCQGPVARMEAGTVSVGSAWTTVTLQQSYLSPVVVATVNYRNNTRPVVTRVRNVTATSFEVRLQNPSDQSIVADSVSYVVVEEGVWVIDGVRIEARRYNSTVTNDNGNWNVSAQSYGQSYTNPVVLGQVMSANDADWSFFWCRGSSRNAPPNATNLRTGKTVGEDSDITRANETIGYIVIERGHGTIGGVAYEAAVGTDIVRGVGNSPPYRYTFISAFAAAPQVGLATTAGMDNTDGAWAQLHGATPLTATQISLSVDEDQIGDSERNHSNEQVGYLVFAQPFVR